MKWLLAVHVHYYNYRCVSHGRTGIAPFCLLYNRRYYSSSSSSSELPADTTKPILTLDLGDKAACIKSYESLLRGKGGIYSLVNTVNGKRYVGSSKDLYIRLNEHLKYKNNSNLALQKRKHL